MTYVSTVILVIIDGLSDVSHCTPLQQANIPTLDHLTSLGRLGLLDPVQPGLACGSDTAHLSLFGYDPTKCYRGRGAFEALGGGVEILPGDVAFKCNFAYVQDGIVVKRCAEKSARMHKLGKQLASQLNGFEIEGFEDVQVGIFHMGGHRCVVRLRGDCSDQVSNSDPLVDGGRLLRVCAQGEQGERTACLLNELSRCIEERLKGCLTNVLLLRGASKGIEVESFESLHGMKAFLIAPTKIIAGVGITTGIEVVNVKGATGGFDTDLTAKGVECVRRVVEGGYDLGIVHVKAVDEAGHERSWEKKVEWLEKVDTMVEEIVNGLRQAGKTDVAITVTGDHTTATRFGDHTCEAVPILVADIREEGPKCVARDAARRFDEVHAATYGSLGRFGGIQLMQIVKTLLGKS